MPIYDYPSDHGDLLVTYTVEMPQTLTTRQQECKNFKLIYIFYRVQRSIFYVILILKVIPIYGF